jgi:hypothetical protein
VDQETRQGKIERIEERRRTGAHRRRRNCPGKPADLRIFGDEFRRPRFVPSGKTKGREERGARASYRRGSRAKRAGIEAGVKISPATVSSEEETVGGDEANRWVPPVIRGREEEAVPVQGEDFLGHGPVSCLGRLVSPRPIFRFFFSFLLFLFCFLKSFITFAF